MACTEVAWTVRVYLRVARDGCMLGWEGVRPGRRQVLCAVPAGTAGRGTTALFNMQIVRAARNSCLPFGCFTAVACHGEASRSDTVPSQRIHRPHKMSFFMYMVVSHVPQLGLIPSHRAPQGLHPPPSLATRLQMFPPNTSHYS